MRRIELADSLQQELEALKVKIKATDMKKKEFELSVNKAKTEMNSLKTMERGWKDAAKAVYSSMKMVTNVLDSQFDQIIGGLKGFARAQSRIKSNTPKIGNLTAYISNLQKRCSTMENEMLANTYQSKTDKQHVLDNPDTYVGSVETLREVGVRCGFTVQAVPLVAMEGVAVSSTAVREALDAGNLPFAAQLLGRSYAVTARVQRGKQLGRTLGYPTLNLRLHRRRVPLGGIFAVRVTGGGLEHWPGVASLGTRPTVDVDGEVLLEVHLFDWQGDLYGAHVTVEFVAWQRPELRFESLEALVLQMNEDAAEARRRLAAA
jgi:hypothetical protein